VRAGLGLGLRARAALDDRRRVVVQGDDPALTVTDAPDVDGMVDRRRHGADQ
jgi:hypothetical protein